MARSTADSGGFDRRRRVSHGRSRERTHRRSNNACSSWIVEPTRSIPQTFVLSPYARKYVLDSRSQWHAAGALSLILAFSIAGRLLMGWLADRFSKKHVMLLTYSLVAAGTALLFLGH